MKETFRVEITYSYLRDAEEWLYEVKINGIVEDGDHAGSRNEATNRATSFVDQYLAENGVL